MPKRFIDADIWGKAWHRRLSTEHKLILRYLFDSCDRAGFWEIDEEKMLFDMNLVSPIQDPWKPLKDITERAGWIWVTDFIEFQYPGGLQRNNRAHKGIIDALSKQAQRFPEILKEGAYKTLIRGYGIGIGIGKGIGKGESEGKVRHKAENDAGPYSDLFGEWWEVYPRHSDKRKAFDAYLLVIGSGVIHKTLRVAAGQYSAWTKAHETPKDKIKMGATWLNNRCWEDDYEIGPIPDTEQASAARSKARHSQERSAEIQAERELARLEAWAVASRDVADRMWEARDDPAAVRDLIRQADVDHGALGANDDGETVSAGAVGFCRVWREIRGGEEEG